MKRLVCNCLLSPFTDICARRVSRDLTGGLARSHLQGTRSDEMATEPLEARHVRLGKNQALFRAVNGQIEQLASEQQRTVGPVSFLCECASPDCGAPSNSPRASTKQSARYQPTSSFCPTTPSTRSRRSRPLRRGREIRRWWTRGRSDRRRIPMTRTPARSQRLPLRASHALDAGGASVARSS